MLGTFASPSTQCCRKKGGKRVPWVWAPSVWAVQPAGCGRGETGPVFGRRHIPQALDLVPHPARPWACQDPVGPSGRSQGAGSPPPQPAPCPRPLARPQTEGHVRAGGVSGVSRARVLCGRVGWRREPKGCPERTAFSRSPPFLLSNANLFSFFLFLVFLSFFNVHFSFSNLSSLFLRKLLKIPFFTAPFSDGSPNLALWGQGSTC